MNAPLYSALTDLAGQNPLRMHIPGHKGRLGGAFAGLSEIDFTEIPPVGNLYTGEGPVRQAERAFAQRGGARDALFFSGGTTQGIYTMLDAAAGMGGTLILDRGCHKSLCHGMAMLDITPVWLLPEWDLLPRPISPDMVRQALEAHPEAKALCLTSPSYYGVLTPLREIAEICHERGVFLLVDQAHGAHFPFVGLPTGVEEGADLCVVSAHKTLPALGGGSVLYIGKNAPWDPLYLKARSALYATTSPSWPVLASIDYARAALEQHNTYPAVAALTAEYRDRINRETPFHALTGDLDPCRLTVDMGTLGGLSAEALLGERNIYVELADDRFLALVITCQDTRADLERLLAGLKALPFRGEGPARMDPPPPPGIRKSIRNALYGPTEQLPLAQAAGRICAQIVAPYPPGIPVLCPGEEIFEKHVAYLAKKRYNIVEKICVCAKETCLT